MHKNIRWSNWYAQMEKRIKETECKKMEKEVEKENTKWWLQWWIDSRGAIPAFSISVKLIWPLEEKDSEKNEKTKRKIKNQKQSTICITI